jgi:ComF family protein
MAKQFLRELSQGLLHLLLPDLCAGCGHPLVSGETVLCVGCAMQLPLTGFHEDPDNEAARRFAGRVAFERASAYTFFTPGGLMQHLLHGLKYSGRQHIGTWLGESFGHALGRTAWMADVDAVIPVPLHPKKEAARGFNQSALIAAGIAAAAEKPCFSRALLRTRATETQTHKNREERVANVAGAFAVREPSLLTGKHLLLTDDVLTTGATLEAAASALHNINKARVSFATLALAKM